MNRALSILVLLTVVGCVKTAPAQGWPSSAVAAVPPEGSAVNITMEQSSLSAALQKLVRAAPTNVVAECYAHEEPKSLRISAHSAEGAISTLARAFSREVILVNGANVLRHQDWSVQPQREQQSGKQWRHAGQVSIERGEDLWRMRDHRQLTGSAGQGSSSGVSIEQILRGVYPSNRTQPTGSRADGSTPRDHVPKRSDAGAGC